MDLSQLPVSLCKLRKLDKNAIENDRREYWERFFHKVNL